MQVYCIFQALSVIGSCDLYIQTLGWPNFFFSDYEFIFSGDHLLLQKPLTPTTGDWFIGLFMASQFGPSFLLFPVQLGNSRLKKH